MSVINQNLLLSPEGYQISRSVRLRSSATAYFNRTPASASNRDTWTWSGWVKRGSIGGTQGLFAAYGSGTSFATFQFNNTLNKLEFYEIQGATDYGYISDAVFRDPSAWYHVTLVCNTTTATTADRMKLYINGVQQTFTQNYGDMPQNHQAVINYTYQHRIGSNQDAGAYFDGYLTEVNFIDGQALTPSSFGETDAVTGVWKPKKYAGTYGTNGFYLNFSDNSSRLALGHSATGTHVDIVEADGSNQSIQAGLGACRVSTISTANASYTSAVNEYLVVTPGAALPVASSLKIYFDVNYAWANGRNLYINGTQVSSGNVTVATVSGMQEWTINFAGHGITSLSSITTPVNTGGRAVFYGISIDGSAVVSTANDWTPNNISVTAGVTYDSMLDVPTMWADGGNGRGNYCVLNPLSKQGVTISDGNLGFSGTSALSATTTFAYPSSGKGYCEFQITSTPENSTNELLGFGPVGLPGGVTRAYASNGQWFNGSAFVSFGSAWSINDVIGVAADVDSSQISIYKNGTLQGTAQSYTFSDSSPHLRARVSGTTVINANFGQRPFAYTPPTGFKALNTQNLPDSTIKKGNAYFDAVTYTGTGSARSVTGLGFQPDLVWVKGRSVAYSHLLTDSVRGVSKRLVSDSTAAEVTDTDTLTAFNSDGFSWGTGIGGNQNAATYVAWQWKESASAGFDIVTYTGNGSGAARAIAHSLGAAPKLIINKGRSAGTTGTDHWVVQHGAFNAGDYILLSATNAKANSANYWGNTLPNSSNFYVGGGASNVGNENGIGYVAYLFSEVAGFSKFGSYVGNGSADGPFVYCGFRPRFVLIKSSSAAGTWTLWDSSRSTANSTNLTLAPNSSAAESSAINIDFLSNGFKVRHVGDINASSVTSIYAAFAENPFKNSLAR